MKTRLLLSTATLAGIAILAGQMRAGAYPSGGAFCTQADCGDNSGPDVIVGRLIDITKWGTVGSITGYSIGTDSCNIGTENLLWVATNANHPVIAQNIYRLKDGRFEQIGMGWLKHGFTALTLNLCGCGCNGQGGSVLGVGCSDPYGASLNGDQNGFACGGGNICGGLGPRSEVDPALGIFAYPYGAAGQSGDAIYKRIQIDNDDVDPAQNSGALYYGEGQYVTPDDAAANNHNNNASYERILVGSFSGGGWNLSLTGPTTRGCPAIFAWKDNDPAVTIRIVDDFNKGRFYVGYRVTDNGDGTWHYEYAIHNLNSHISAREFIVPIGANDISWSTDTEAANPNANALRWGTLYNFRFDANTPPEPVTATIGLYRPAKPDSLTVTVDGPSAGACVTLTNVEFHDIDHHSGDGNVIGISYDGTDWPATAGAGCPWDCGDGDGAVGADDLLALLAQWFGPGCCDFDGSGTVSTVDLLKLLGHWGLCP